MSTCDVKVRKREENRRKFPFAAELLDELREAFGPGVKLLWASENGAEIGRKSSGPFSVILPYETAAAIKKRVK